MDSPSSTLAGAQVVGGAVVTIGGDIAGLRAAEREAREIVREIGSLQATVNVAAGGMAGAFRQAVAQPVTLAVTNGGVIGREVGQAISSQIVADASQVGAQISGAIAKQLSAEAAHIGQAIAQAFAQAMPPMPGGGDQDGGSGGGGSRGGIGPNYLSRRGIGRLMGNMTAAFAVFEAIHIAGELAEASQIGNHPERIARGFLTIGNTLDPNLVGRQSQVIADAQAHAKAMEAIPMGGMFFGSYIKGQQDVQAHAQSLIEVSQNQHSEAARQAGQAAQLRGDAAASYRAQADERLTGLQRTRALLETQLNEKAKQYIGTMIQDVDPNHPAVATHRWHAASADEARGIVMATDKDLAERITTQDKLITGAKKETEEQEKQLKLDRETAGIRIEAATQATNIRAEGGIGAEAKARSIEAQAELSAKDKQLEAATGRWKADQKELDDKQANPYTKKDDLAAAKQRVESDQQQITLISQQRAQTAAEFEKKGKDAAFAAQQEGAENETRTYTARLEAGRRFYEARLYEMDQANKREIDKAKEDGKLSDADIQKMKDRQEAERSLFITQQKFHDDQVIASSQANVEVARLKLAEVITRDPEYGQKARQRARQQQQDDELKAIDKSNDPNKAAVRKQKEDEFRETNAIEDREFQVQRQRSLENQRIRIDASTQAAQLQAQDKPIAAQAVEARAAMELAVKNADPELRDAVLKEQQAKLKATEHELFDPHTGGYGAIGNSYFIPGNFLDSQKAEADRKKAKEVMQGTGPALDAIAKDAKEWQEGVADDIAKGVAVQPPIPHDPEVRGAAPDAVTPDASEAKLPPDLQLKSQLPAQVKKTPAQVRADNTKRDDANLAWWLAYDGATARSSETYTTKDGLEASSIDAHEDYVEARRTFAKAYGDYFVSHKISATDFNKADADYSDNLKWLSKRVQEDADKGWSSDSVSTLFSKIDNLISAVAGGTVINGSGGA